MKNRLRSTAINSLLFILLITSAGCAIEAEREEYGSYSGDRAYQDVLNQVEIGARHPGTIGHEQVLSYMEEELVKAGWKVDYHEAEIEGKPIVNLIANRGDDQKYILLGAHYDTRIYADQDMDENLRKQPVPGANDGGSGVAVLLELARTLPEELPVPVRLVFFDSEDNGGIEDWDWILGSKAYVRDIVPLPQAAVILDMIGDADLEVYYERNSDHLIREQIWNVGIDLGYGEYFIKEEKHSMLDDHTPFLQAGIPAVDLIDFDYPYWHTTEDTSDKVSPESLQAIGDTITVWLLGL
jgi:Iap family predicted aminopeptidase